MNKPTDKFYRFLQLVWKMERNSEQALRSRLEQHLVSPAQFRILKHLWAKPELSQSELCTLLGIEQPTLSATLTRMVRDGLLTSTQDKKDRRKSRYSLTRKGLELEQPLSLAEKELEETALLGINPVEKGMLIKFIGRVITNLNEDLDDSALVLLDVVSDEPDLDEFQPTEPAPTHS